MFKKINILILIFLWLMPVFSLAQKDDTASRLINFIDRAARQIEKEIVDLKINRVPAREFLDLFNEKTSLIHLKTKIETYVEHENSSEQTLSAALEKSITNNKLFFKSYLSIKELINILRQCPSLSPAQRTAAQDAINELREGLLSESANENGFLFDNENSRQVFDHLTAKIIDMLGKRSGEQLGFMSDILQVKSILLDQASINSAVKSALEYFENQFTEGQKFSLNKAIRNELVELFIHGRYELEPHLQAVFKKEQPVFDLGTSRLSVPANGRPLLVFLGDKKTFLLKPKLQLTTIEKIIASTKKSAEEALPFDESASRESIRDLLTFYRTVKFQGLSKEDIKIILDTIKQLEEADLALGTISEMNWRQSYDSVIKNSADLTEELLIPRKSPLLSGRQLIERGQEKEARKGRSELPERLERIRGRMPVGK